MKLLFRNSAPIKRTSLLALFCTGYVFCLASSKNTFAKLVRFINASFLTLGIAFFLCLNLFCQSKVLTPQEPMQDTAYPFPVKKIVLSDSLEIAYMDEGRGDYTLLMIHGLGSYAPAWNKNLESLVNNYRCIAVDLPNYGHSQKGDFPSSMTYFAQVLSDFITKLELKKVVLLGHSMGGQIACHLVLSKKTPIEKLVLVAPAGFETFSESEKQWFRQVLNPLVLKATPTEQIRSNFNLNFYGNALPDDALFMYEDRLALMNQIEDYNFYCNMIPKCVLGMLNEPVFDRLQEITIPTLVLFGNEDLLIPNRYLHPNQTLNEVATKGVGKLPNAQLSLLSPCGHFVQWDCSTEVNRMISTFLEKN